MLLLPYSTESKLLAKWQGPHEEVWRIGPFDYDGLCPDKQEREKGSSRQLIESLVGTGSGFDPPRWKTPQVRETAGPRDVLLPDISEDHFGEAVSFLLRRTSIVAPMSRKDPDTELRKDPMGSQKRPVHKPKGRTNQM